MKGLIHTRDGKLSAERHEMSEEYERFDQKHNMIYACEWKEEYAGVNNAARVASRAKHIANKVPGYGREDIAFVMASSAGTGGSRFVINRSDSGGTSWSPIKRSTVGGATIDELPLWEGTPEENTRLVKKLAVRYGAGDVGLCMLDRRYVYSRYYDPSDKQSYAIKFSDEEGFEQYTKPQTLPDKTQIIPKEMKYAIVMVYPMELEGIATAPRPTHMGTTLETYSQIAFTSMSLAEFIRGLGYNAIPSSNDTAASIPMAIDAGLGELSRSAKLAHPQFGTSCRISKIITDLPLVPDKPIAFGVYEFCKVCKRCAERCPVKAISLDDDMTSEPRGEFSVRHIRQWQLDHAKCREMFTKAGTNCGLCLANCPLNRENTFSHRVKKSIMSAAPAFDRILLKSMIRSGGGKLQNSAAFWEKLKKTADKKIK